MQFNVKFKNIIVFILTPRPVHLCRPLPPECRVDIPRSINFATHRHWVIELIQGTQQETVH